MPSGAGSTRSPTVARNGFGALPMQLDRRAGADRPLDADRGRLAELDVDAVLVGERRLDDLLLHLAVERHRQLRRDVVLAQVDQRVLLGELGRARRAARLCRRGGGRRRRSPASAARSGARSSGVARAADRVADPDRRRDPRACAICPAATDAARSRRAAVEHADRGDLAPRARRPSWHAGRGSRTVPANIRT